MGIPKVHFDGNKTLGNKDLPAGMKPSDWIKEIMKESAKK